MSIHRSTERGWVGLLRRWPHLRRMTAILTLLAVVFSLVPCEAIAAGSSPADLSSAVLAGAPDDTTPSEAPADACDCLCASRTCPAHAVVEAEPATTVGAPTTTRDPESPTSEEVRSRQDRDGIFRPPRLG